MLALLMAGGLLVALGPVDRDALCRRGRPRRSGPRRRRSGITPYKPNDAQIAFHLARFLTDVRSLSIDPIVVRQNWLEAYEYATDRGAATLNDYARTNDPVRSRIGQSSVAVEVTSVVRASDASFQVRWIERTYANGVRRPALSVGRLCLSVVLQPPRTEERLRRNPLGIYVNGLSWSRELEATQGVKAMNTRLRAVP